MTNGASVSKSDTPPSVEGMAWYEVGFGSAENNTGVAVVRVEFGSSFTVDQAGG